MKAASLRLAGAVFLAASPAWAKTSAWDQLAKSRAALSGAASAPAPRLAPRPAQGRFGSIDLKGSPAFIAETTRALTLLQRSGDLPEVERRISAIRQARCSGIVVQTGVYGVGDPTWKAGTVWYAGTIAHDSRHARLYQDALAAQGGKGPVDSSVYFGAEAEKKCLAFQLQVLERLHAGSATLNYIRQTKKAPTYQNIGAGSADVCSKRNW